MDGDPQLHPQARPIPRLHLRVHDAEPATARGGRHAGLLPGNPALGPPDGAGVGAPSAHPAHAEGGTFDRATHPRGIPTAPRTDLAASNRSIPLCRGTSTST